MCAGIVCVCVCQAQGLGAVITTSSKLKGSDQHLYLIVDGRKCLGLIKVGVKKLFIRVRGCAFVDTVTVAVGTYTALTMLAHMITWSG